MEEKKTQAHGHAQEGHGHHHHGGHEHGEEEMKVWRPVVSAVMLLAGLAVEYGLGAWPLGAWTEPVWYVLAFLPVGLPVMHEAWEAIEHERDFFSEFMLMSVACVGAFAIGEYPEAVAVMLLYCIGEAFQDRAVERARNNISSLMAFRPDHARVVEGDEISMESPEIVTVGAIVEVRPGERVPLDGVLLTADAAFDTAALTGESVPRTIQTDGEVLAGMIATENVVRLRVTRPASESAVSRILNMVEEASERKAPTELFIHRFAHVYTPVVIALAALTVVLPWFYSMLDASFAFVFSQWLHHALVFLVISCPCALVISVPLSYFAGIGAASKRGILFKGGNYLDAVTELQTVVFDKTGTLTTGRFAVKEVSGLDAETLKNVVFIEKTSSHPIAQAICRYAEKQYADDAAYSAARVSACAESIQNVSGYGLTADGWLVGTLRLLDKEGVAYPEDLKEIPETIVVVAHDGQYLGYLLLADVPKADAHEGIAALHALGKCVVILSGDKQALVNKVAQQLGVDQAHAYGDLLPEDKANKVLQIKGQSISENLKPQTPKPHNLKTSNLKPQNLKPQNQQVAFVGDGINDAPVLALSDVGIAMGAMGADMAIETADIIIQTDQPSKVAEAIAIGRRTRSIVHQNIAMAIGIKLLVLILGFLGVANLWEAVFADSGVALLAVLNSTRIFLRR